MRTFLHDDSFESSVDVILYSTSKTVNIFAHQFSLWKKKEHKLFPPQMISNDLYTYEIELQTVLIENLWPSDYTRLNDKTTPVQNLTLEV